MNKIDLRQTIQPIRNLVMWAKITDDEAIGAPWEWFAARVGALERAPEGFTPEEADQLAAALTHAAERVQAVAHAITQAADAARQDRD